MAKRSRPSSSARTKTARARSLAAKRGWATRRAAAAKRSAAARRGWETRKANARKAARTAAAKSRTSRGRTTPARSGTRRDTAGFLPKRDRNGRFVASTRKPHHPRVDRAGGAGSAGGSSGGGSGAIGADVDRGSDEIFEEEPDARVGEPYDGLDDWGSVWDDWDGDYDYYEVETGVDYGDETAS